MGALVLAIAPSAAGQSQGPASPVAPSPPLTIDQQLAQAKVSMSEMESWQWRVHKLLEQARRQRDVIKLECVNDKLTQIDFALRSARDRLVALDVAARNKNVGEANHQLTLLKVLFDRVMQLHTEAEACVGIPNNIAPGEASVTVSIENNLPSPSIEPPTDSTLVSGPPACTSCTGTGH